MVLTSKQLAALRRAPADKGNRLAAAIDLTQVTQTALADELGMGNTYVSDVVRGRYQTVTMANARRFAEYFGCSIEDLFPAKVA